MSEENKEEILEKETVITEKPKKENIFKRICGGIKKPFSFVWKKTDKQREFIRAGRAGGMIADTILGAQFFCKSTLEGLPVIWAFLLSVIIVAAVSELLNLVVKFIFGGGNRRKAYFITTFICVAFCNNVGTQEKIVLVAVIMSFLLTLSVHTVGSCIWAFIKSRKFKQVFGYVMTTLSLVYLLLYGFMYRNDNFGESRVDFYNKISTNSGKADSAVGTASGFDAYLENGSYTVKSLSYGLEADADIVTETLDYSGFDSMENRSLLDKLKSAFTDYDYAKTPVKGKIWYPEGASNCPTLFIVHGAHDGDVPSYLGYEYLGSYLASNGYVVVSVDENIINKLGEGNDKRAILLLDNMKAILSENETNGSLIYGLIDPDRIAIGGHSRGGEMVATAYLFNNLDAYPEDGNLKFDYHFNITSIIAIAPVVDQYTPLNHSVEISDVNYFLIHGSNDQDVSNMMGEKQYNNVTFSHDTDKFFVKSSVYILGANHGQFNTLWGQYDMAGALNGYLNTNNFISEADQKTILKAYMRVFLDTTILGEDTYASLLEDISGYKAYLPDTTYITNYEDSDFISLFSFDDTTDISNGNDNAKLEVTGTDTWTLKPYERGNGNESEDYVLSCKWSENAEPSIKVSVPGIDISKGYLNFAIADMREHTEDITSEYDYTVQLTDASGKTAVVHNPQLVYPALAVQLYKQDIFFKSYEYKHQFQTVRLTPEMFGESGFDFSNITSITITTDGSKEGELYIDDIGYYKEK
ncbi:MAG: hypothetical protein J5802_04160 [Butyrivibrio sp.]|nr:hypothetical protein [Butyrivibrio sp.]